jgi:cytochrome c oxidase subunit III
LSDSDALARSGLQHHFDSLEQQHEASSLGMWVFLVTEVMFFGGMFTAYVVYRTFYPVAFADASRHLDITLGGVNTAVLICSSLTMALAVHGSQVGNRKALIGFLILTALLGLTFLGIKAVEYADKFEHHLVPGNAFAYPGPDARQVQLFFSVYFAMTGLHALHMIIGVGVLSVLLVKAWRGVYSPAYHTPVEVSGLYWHFVDIVWIFLFPLLYLIGRHQ